MQKKVLICGAGIAGLSAGCFALMNGLDAIILEQNNESGGLTQTWNLGEYSFNKHLCLVHGISPYSLTNKLWKDLSVIPQQKFVSSDEFNAVFYDNDSIFHAYADPNKLQQEMLLMSPEDTDLINQWIGDLKVLEKIDTPVDFTWEHLGLYYIFTKLVSKYKMPPWKYALQFKNPLLADIFTKAFTVHDQSLIYTMMSLNSLNKKNSGYPVDGVDNISKILENRFINLGGKILFQSKVNQILIQSNKAIGVSLESNRKIYGDGVISCADGFTTFFDWIDKKYWSIRLKEVYKKIDTYPPVLLVSLGINRDYSHLPNRFVLSFPKGVLIDFAKVNQLSVENVDYRRTLIPGDKTVFQLVLPTNYKIWQKYNNNPVEYEFKKKQVLDNCISALIQKLPDLPSQIEFTDVATPITFNRYSGNWQGSYQGFMVKEKKKFYRIPQNLPLIKRFYMAGHWTKVGGGVYQAASSAKVAIRKLCHELKVSFKY